MINKFIDFMKDKLQLWLLLMWGTQWLLGKDHIVSYIFACIGLISAICYLKSKIDEDGIKETVITYIKSIVILIIILFSVKYMCEYLNFSITIAVIIAMILFYLFAILSSLIGIDNKKEVVKALIMGMISSIPIIAIVIIVFINIGFILSLLYLAIK